MLDEVFERSRIHGFQQQIRRLLEMRGAVTFFAVHNDNTHTHTARCQGLRSESAVPPFSVLRVVSTAFSNASPLRLLPLCSSICLPHRLRRAPTLLHRLRHPSRIPKSWNGSHSRERCRKRWRSFWPRSSVNEKKSSKTDGETCDARVSFFFARGRSSRSDVQHAKNGMQ